MGDQEQRRRGPHPGVRHPKTYLRAAEVDDMRYRFEELEQTVTEIARAYGVPRRTVHDIVHYNTWPP